jgi:hypothetical protein
VLASGFEYSTQLAKENTGCDIPNCGLGLD